MRIDATNQGVNMLGAMAEAPRAQYAAASGNAGDVVNLASRALGDDMPSGLAEQISSNAGDALAAHSRLDPERALRLLGLLD